MVICSTGFEGVDLLHMSKAVKLMGLCMHSYEGEQADQAQAQATTNT